MSAKYMKSTLSLLDQGDRVRELLTTSMSRAIIVNVVVDVLVAVDVNDFLLSHNQSGDSHE